MGELELREDLSPVDWQDFSRGLHFHDYRSFNHQIEPIPAV
jgi:hypothetical protein